MSVEMERSEREMCNLSEIVWEEGKKEGKREGRIATLMELVRNGVLTAEQAAERSGVGIAVIRQGLTPLYSGE